MRRSIVLGMVLAPLALTVGCSGVDVRCDRKLQPINRPAMAVLPGSQRAGPEAGIAGNGAGDGVKERTRAVTQP